MERLNRLTNHLVEGFLPQKLTPLEIVRCLCKIALFGSSIGLAVELLDALQQLYQFWELYNQVSSLH